MWATQEGTALLGDKHNGLCEGGLFGKDVIRPQLWASLHCQPWWQEAQGQQKAHSQAGAGG